MVAWATRTLALLGDLQRADELDLREIFDRRAREVAPFAPVCRRVDDHGPTGACQSAGDRHEGAIHGLALGVVVRRRWREGSSKCIQLEDAHAFATRGKLGRGGARDRGLATAWESRDPERPAHAAAPNSAATSEGSKRQSSIMQRAKRIRAARVAWTSVGYQRGCAMTSARNARKGGITLQSSVSPEALR